MKKGWGRFHIEKNDKNSVMGFWIWFYHEVVEPTQGRAFMFVSIPIYTFLALDAPR